ncbi:MAG: DNA double-strand break repair nuclease NurA [Prochloraceae cyanobacterium]
MLDLNKLAKKIPGIGQHLNQEAIASRLRLEKAQKLLEEAKEKQDKLTEDLEEWRDRLIFAAAKPIEPLDTAIDLDVAPESHSVFATDGSQISPSHHEIAYCYLINIGRIMLHYGQSLHPLLDSIPEVYYKAEDLYASRQWGIKTEEWMGYRRTVAEIEILAEMACRWVKPPGAHYNIPNLAMVDGSLIYWFLDNLPPEAKDCILPPIMNAQQQLEALKIPFMGYLSVSRSIESIDFLRLAACPHKYPNCTVNCGHLRDSFQEKPPCQIIDPLRDTTIWGTILKPGQRSALWESNLNILKLYDESQRVYFCYVNVGTEIARIEVPAWVAKDKELFDRSCAIMLSQVYKGYGYPVTLAEAHNQAVVRGGDRARFFALLEQQMIRA